jgi:hypothetical protein
MAIFDSILRAIVSALSPLANSNLVIFVLSAAAVALGAVLFYTPQMQDIYLRSGRSERANLLDRLIRPARQLRGSEQALGINLQNQLFRDGKLDNPIDDTSEVFFLVRFVMAFVMFCAGFVLMIGLGGEPLLLGLGAVGYFLPIIFAKLHNRGRAKKIEKELPAALQRLQTRVAANGNIPEAFRKVSELREGPLYSELDWAYRQMNIPGADMFETLKRLDDRCGSRFWAPLAEQIKRAKKRGDKSLQETFQNYVERRLEKEISKIEQKAEGVVTRLSVAMTPFLLLAVLLSIASGIVVNASNGTFNLH